MSLIFSGVLGVLTGLRQAFTGAPNFLLEVVFFPNPGWREGIHCCSWTFPDHLSVFLQFRFSLSRLFSFRRGLLGFNDVSWPAFLCRLEGCYLERPNATGT